MVMLTSYLLIWEEKTGLIMQFTVCTFTPTATAA
jgi:hypothetical protein